MRAPTGNRTLDLLLTMETLCRLSYRGTAKNLSNLAVHAPDYGAVRSGEKTHANEEQMLSVAGAGFEPAKHEATDLQSVPFGRSGNPPDPKPWAAYGHYQLAC